MRAMEALRRLEARGGWDEADLNDFAIIELALCLPISSPQTLEVTDTTKYRTLALRRLLKKI